MEIGDDPAETDAYGGKERMKSANGFPNSSNGQSTVKMRGVEGLERFQAQLYSTQMGNPG